MGLHGGMALVHIEAGRARIPPHFADRLNWLAGKEPIAVWLLVVEPGRYRLLTAAHFEGSQELRRLLSEPDGSHLLAAHEAESATFASLTARLMPTTVAAPPPGWRIHIPREFFFLLTPGADKENVFLLFSGQYLELWFPEVLIQSLRTPLDQIVP